MSYRTIEWNVDGPVGTIRLNRPERMNAVVEEMYRELRDVLDAARDDPAVRCLILTGSVLRRDGVEKQAFCAGADLKKHDAGERGPAERRAYIELAHETTRAIHEHPKPVLAAVNGPARGAGVEMALSCDLVLMADGATLALPEIGLGTFVGGGVTAILPSLVGPARARELIYTGRVVDGPTAVELGLALESHPLEALEARARELASAIAEKAPISVGLAKRLLREASGSDLGAALDRETEAILSCMETADWREGVRAFVEKRKPKFEGR